MNDEKKYHEDRELQSFPGIRWGVGERMLKNAKGLLCSRMFTERVGPTASLPKHVQILATPALRQDEYKLFFGFLILNNLGSPK